MCQKRVCLTAVTALCILGLASLATAEDVVWDFENGNSHGFALKCQNPATPAPDKPDIAGDEKITGVGGPKGLPAAGVAWTICDLYEYKGLLAAITEGNNIVNGRLNPTNSLPKGEGPSQLGQTGYLNTYALTQWGDALHAAENDQIAASPLVELGEGSVMTVHALGGTSTYIAPEFDADATKGYKNNSCGVAVLNAAGAIVSSTFMPSQNWREYTIDLSGLASQKVYIEVVDAFAGGWGWMAVDQIKITNAKVVGDSSRPFAVAPSPADGATGVQMPLLQWKAGEGAVSHRVYFGTTPELTAANIVSPMQPLTMFYYGMPLTPGATYYWRVDEIAKDGSVREGSVWRFTTAPVAAYNPAPADTAMYVDPTELLLEWTPGKNAIRHDVYFGADKDAVAAGTANTAKGSQIAVDFNPGALSFDTTYYWRVDETDMANAKIPGAVWSFTTTSADMGGAKREIWANITGTSLDALRNDSRFPGEPTDVNELSNFESPENYSDNYGGRLSAWLHVPVAGDYTFWLASDDSGELYLGEDPDSAKLIANIPSWSGARAWDTMGSQKSKPISLQAGRYYLAALWKEGEGGDNCSAAWQGPGIPERTLIADSYLKPFVALWAYGPRPANGAVNTRQDIPLTWTAGVNATQHDVYFGADKDAVANATTAAAGVYRGRQAFDKTSFDPGPLDWNATYYWRIDEIGAGENWKGAVWSFTTADFIVVDDMESYTDDDAGRIYQTWIDGYVDQSSGSTVGHLNAPFAEKAIVHGGGQSMPMYYDNSRAPYYSEAEQVFAPVQNWTVNGVTDLTLFVRGYPAAGTVAVTEAAGKISLAGAGADIWNNSDEFTYAYKSLNGDGTLTARVVSTGTGANTWAKGGVMVRDSLNGGSAHATMAITGGGGNGASFQYRADTNGGSASIDSGAAIAPPYWVRMERAGGNLTGYVSSDGKSWNLLGTTTIGMEGSVTIGLAVTSHVAGTNRTFEFDNVSLTGAVSGAWQGAIINAAVHNSAQPLYVTVEDSAGKKATVTNATAVTAANWTEVKIPLSSFAGVSMTKVKKLIVGVGDHANPTAAGSGLIFVDDVRVTKP